MYESPDNGKTVYQRAIGSNHRVKVKGNDVPEMEVIVTESGNVINYYPNEKEN